MRHILIAALTFSPMYWYIIVNESVAGKYKTEATCQEVAESLEIGYVPVCVPSELSLN